jgi:hypothetical protein
MRALWIVVACVTFAAGCASAQKEDKPRPVTELDSGGARLRGGKVRMDVQLGRALVQRSARTPTGVVATPNAAVAP